MRFITKAAIRIIILIMGLKLLFALSQDISWFISDTVIFKEEIVFSYMGVILGEDIFGLIVLCFLWWKTDWLVKLLCGKMDNGALVINTSNIDFITVMIQIIGIYLVVTSIPDFIGLAVYYVQIRSKYPGFDISEYQVQETKQFVITGVTFVIGLLMLSGSKWFVKKIRGVENSEQPK